MKVKENAVKGKSKIWRTNSLLDVLTTYLSIRIRTRAPLIPVVSCGKTCKNQNETKPCLIYPVPCQLSEWSEWSPCTSRCGIGVQLRDRKVVIPAKCNGSCGVLNGFQICRGTYCKNTNTLIATSAKGK